MSNFSACFSHSPFKNSAMEKELYHYCRKTEAHRAFLPLFFVQKEQRFY